MTLSSAEQLYDKLEKSIPVAIFARVSSDKQAKGDSIPHQISYAKDAILRLGREYYTDDSLIYVDEGISGYYNALVDRPAIQRLINDARLRRFKVVIFKEIARIGRDPEENIKLPNILNSFGVRVISINDSYDSDNPDTKIVFSLQSVLAEKESDKLGTRVSVGYREKARSGKWSTIAPYGYRIDENYRLQIVEEKGKMVSTMFDMYVNKRIGTELIAKYLNDNGIPSPKGTLWDKMSVRRILLNEAYIGKIVYGKTRAVVERIYDDNNNLIKKKRSFIPREDYIIVENAHDPLVDEETFLKVKEIMASRSHGEFRGNRAKHPLVGLLKCSKCGSGFICQARISEGRNYRYYKCSKRHRIGKDACTQDIINANELELVIYNALVKRLNKYKVSNDLHVEGTIEVDSLNQRMEKLEKEKKKLTASQLQMTKDRELYTDESFRDVMIGIKKNIEHVESQINLVHSQIKETTGRNSNLSFISDLINKMNDMDLNDQVELRSFFHKLIEGIEIQDKETIENITYKYQI